MMNNVFKNKEMFVCLEITIRSDIEIPVLLEVKKLGMHRIFVSKLSGPYPHPFGSMIAMPCENKVLSVCNCVLIIHIY